MTIKTRKHDVEIKNTEGETIFERKGFEIPEAWGDRAALIVASKYATNSETSAIQIIDRVVNTITAWGIEHDYFSSPIDALGNEESTDYYKFSKSLKEILIDQRAAFNTPVNMNLGAPGHDQQAAACFLGHVEDTMEDIAQHVTRATKVFKSGSGIGLNVSNIRGEGEKLSNKGSSSGIISFMRMWDKASGTVKSGGRSRRAAVLLSMEPSHPDIQEFIHCKSDEEKKARVLIDAGISVEEAYSTIDFQNANHSIAVSDKFMKAVENNEDWELTNRADKKVAKVLKAQDLFNEVCEQAWNTGDPGLQFLDRINYDNPVQDTGIIEVSNPCQPAEATVLTPMGIKTFADIDVGSIIWSGKNWTNVVKKVATGVKPVFKYRTTAGYFLGTEDHQVIQNGKRVKAKEAKTIDIAEEPMSLSSSSEKTSKIVEITKMGDMPVWDITVESEDHTYWTGGLLVSNCGEIYGIRWTSCNLCSINILKYLKKDNTFDLVKLQADVNLLVMAQDILIEGAYYPTEDFKRVSHSTRPIGLGLTNLGALLMIMGYPYDSDEARGLAKDLYEQISKFAALQSIDLAKKFGSFSEIEVGKNREYVAQVMGRVTGDLGIYDAVVQHGIRNSQVTTSMPAGTVSFMLDADSTGTEPLFALSSVKQLTGGGFMEIVPDCVQEALGRFETKTVGSLRGKQTDLSVSSLSEEDKRVFATANEISVEGHIRMMAALQSRISSGISKTVNLPASATVEDVKNAYMMAWKEGLKGITIYRDGSKSMQPLTAKKDEKDTGVKTLVKKDGEERRTIRRRLPDERKSITHKFDIGGFEGYITAGMYEDGTPGELFIRASTLGSAASGLLDSFSIAISMALQYGVPLEHLVEKLKNVRFEPAGVTRNAQLPIAKSIVSYVFTWLERKFLEVEVKPDSIPPIDYEKAEPSGDLCTSCGSLMQRLGGCWYCSSCSSSTGCS